MGRFESLVGSPPSLVSTLADFLEASPKPSCRRPALVRNNKDAPTLRIENSSDDGAEGWYLRHGGEPSFGVGRHDSPLDDIMLFGNSIDPWPTIFDLVKLEKEMKRMVDRLVDAGVHDVAVCGGMLIKGFRCETFTMDLKLDGIYRMTQVAHFYLLCDASDFLLATHVIETLLQVKRIILNTVALNAKKNNNNYY
ncbi:unnamed protein product [Absidia cylindrospora]